MQMVQCDVLYRGVWSCDTGSSTQILSFQETWSNHNNGHWSLVMSGSWGEWGEIVSQQLRSRLTRSVLGLWASHQTLEETRGREWERNYVLSHLYLFKLHWVSRALRPSKPFCNIPLTKTHTPWLHGFHALLWQIVSSWTLLATSQV